MVDVTVPLASIGEVGPLVVVVDHLHAVVAGTMLDVVIGTTGGISIIGAVVALVEDRSLVLDVASSVISTVMLWL